MVKNGKGSLPSFSSLLLSLFITKLSVFCFYSALLLSIKTFDDTDTLDPPLSLHPTSLSYLLSLSLCLLRIQDELWCLVFCCSLFWSVVVLHVIPASYFRLSTRIFTSHYVVCMCIYMYLYCCCMSSVLQGGGGGGHTHKQAVSTSGTGS